MLTKGFVIMSSTASPFIDSLTRYMSVRSPLNDLNNA